MSTQSQKNEKEIIKLQGELKLIHNKIDTIKNNHLQHIDYKINNIYKLKRGVKVSYKNDKKNRYFVNGIEYRIEQIIANLLDNAVSFSEDNKEIIVKVSKSNINQVIINILDEGEGFKEKDTSKIFNRFYSNRPDKFGQHSGLGLNIVKNLVDLHNATIKASNRIDQKGASMEIIFPKV